MGQNEGPSYSASPQLLCPKLLATNQAASLPYNLALVRTWYCLGTGVQLLGVPTLPASLRASQDQPLYKWPVWRAPAMLILNLSHLDS